jgi:hypothetical protein
LFPETNNLQEAIPSATIGSDNVCRFPAQAYYQHIATGKRPPDFHQCTELQRYLQQVPVGEVSLVYASENLISPSSMKGHVFIKLSGIRSNGETAQHAVSFYTDLDGINFPKLFFQSIFIGKKGVFALAPYSSYVEQYVRQEQRNLWEYKIALTEIQKRLIQLHIWEIRHADLPYFFDRYNCATFMSHVLRVGRPEITLPDVNKVSPVDLVKALDQANIVTQTSVFLSPEWQTRMLSQTVDPKWTAYIKKNKPDIAAYHFDSDDEKFLVASLAMSYVDYQESTQRISPEQATQLKEIYKGLKEVDDTRSIDISSFKSPTKLPNDSQWYAGFVSHDDRAFIRIGHLPSGLRKEDDSSQYFGNNELRIMEGSVLFEPETKELTLDEFVFYAVSSLNPYHAMTGGVSGEFELSIKDHYNHELEAQTSLVAHIGMGLTSGLTQDLSVYIMPAIGAGYGRGHGYLYSDLETGIVANVVFDSKFRASFSRVWGQVSPKSYFDQAELTLATVINNNWSVSLGVRHIIGKNNTFDETSLMLKYLY